MSQQTCSVLELPTSDPTISSAKKSKDRDYAGVIAQYTRSIQLDPRDALAFCYRGVAHYRLGEHHSAMADYNRSIEIDPNLAIAYYRRGFLHYLTKDFSSAIVDYNKSIALKPDFAMAYSNRGYAYRELYGEQEALIDFRWAAKLFKEQGNLEKHDSMLKSIDRIVGADDSCASGML